MSSGRRQSVVHFGRQAAFIARMGVAFAIEQRVRPWRWIGAIAVVLGLAPLVQGPRWVGVLTVTLGIAWWSTVTFIVRVAVRLLMPPRVRKLRADVDELVGEVRTAARAIGVPLSVLDGVRFAWALARGKRPHDEVLANVAAFTECLEAAIGEDGLRRIFAMAPEDEALA